MDTAQHSIRQLLDHGYVRLIESWGSDERIIEAARMSTDKGFLGWESVYRCPECGTRWTSHSDAWLIEERTNSLCSLCMDSTNRLTFGDHLEREHPGDAKLLAYLYNHKHMTPFEMAGMVIEVKAPIFVFREWHRHRTQSYNEMSARYIPLPDENYMPSMERCAPPPLSETNRQATGGGRVPTEREIKEWRGELEHVYRTAQQIYARGIALGIPKELARLPVPVARYSRMRASSNLRNWLAFLTLRQDKNAQLEIRVYANAVAELISQQFPRTHALFAAGGA